MGEGGGLKVYNLSVEGLYNTGWMTLSSIEEVLHTLPGVGFFTPKMTFGKDEMIFPIPIF